MMTIDVTENDDGTVNVVRRGLPKEYFELINAPKDPVTVHMESCLYVFGETTTEVTYYKNMPPPFERISVRDGD